MCDAGQEGITAKRVDAPYRSDRTRSWVKVKCTRRQEFVIIGWTKSKAKGRAFSSLLLAQHEGRALVYKGKVGTDATPAEVPRAEATGAQWIRPKLAAEVAPAPSESRIAISNRDRVLLSEWYATGGHSLKEIGAMARREGLGLSQERTRRSRQHRP